MLVDAQMRCYKYELDRVGSGREGDKMVRSDIVKEQLEQVGCNYELWGRTEVGELARVLVPEEQIMQAVNGYYNGGFALLCATNFRVLLIDKKPLALTVEDLRYDMIVEVDYGSRILTSVIHIYTPLQTLDFTSWSMRRLRKCMDYIQQRVMELRNSTPALSRFAQVVEVNAQQPGMGRPGFGAGFADRRLVPGYEAPAAAGQQANPQSFVNPYTKTPLLSRRRRYPMLY